MQDRFKTWIRGPNPTNYKGKLTLSQESRCKAASSLRLLQIKTKISNQQPRKKELHVFLTSCSFFSDRGSERLEFPEMILALFLSFSKVSKKEKKELYPIGAIVEPVFG